MSGYTILDPKQHKNLKVIQTRGLEFGDNHHFVPVLADELKALVAEYAICFLKDNQTGQFGINALMGFEPGENLYLDGDSWQAHYIPVHLMCQPFMVGIKGEEGDTPTPENTLITVNLESPRISDDMGEAIFDEDGKNTPFLDQINQLLVKLVQGMPRTEQFIRSVLELELLTPVKLDFTLKNGEKKSFGGLYSLDEEKVAALSGKQLESFHQKGYLQACHLIISSFAQIQKLIDWKNRSCNKV